MIKNSPQQYAFILGAHPKLSFMELRAVLEMTRLKVSASQLQLRGSIALLKSDAPLDIAYLMQTLGGTIKIAQIEGKFEEEKIMEWLFAQIKTDSKFHFGFSLYQLNSAEQTFSQKEWQTMHQLGLTLKKILRGQGISCRFVESRDLTLSSVIVQKERLLKNGVEIILLKNDHEFLFGQTLAVQPFAQFSQRDYGRPARDAHAGMLPPKVARMMINIAQPTARAKILDPFCGSGTILQEALLLGYKNISGADISAKAINDTKKNLSWLAQQNNQPGLTNFSPANIPLYNCNALNLHKVMAHNAVDCIVTEGDLGTSAPRDVKKIKNQLQQFYKNVLPVLARLLKPNGRLVIALPAYRAGRPAWKKGRDIDTLALDYVFQELHLRPFYKSCFYGRPSARVLRQIHFLTKKMNDLMASRVE